MNKQQGFSVVAVIIIVLAVIAGGLYVYQKSLAPVTNTNITDPTADWQTYRNDEYGFEFKYPKSFSLKDGLNEVYPGTGFFAVGIKNESVSENPNWSFSINGQPCYQDEPQLVYVVKKDSDGTVDIAQQRSQEGGVIQVDGSLGGDPSSSNLSFVTAGLIEGDRAYRWCGAYERGGENYQSLFGQILSTFRFTK